MLSAPASSLSDASIEGPSFSTLELRDHVVIIALFEQLVTEEQVAALWRVWRMRHMVFMQEPFWRLLLLLSNTNAEELYKQAARVASIETAFLGRHAVFAAIRQVKHQLPRAAWKKLSQACIVPIGEQGYGSNPKGQVFATNDTTNPHVRKLIESVWPDPYEVRYAPQAELQDLLDEERNERLSS